MKGQEDVASSISETMGLIACSPRSQLAQLLYANQGAARRQDYRISDGSMECQAGSASDRIEIATSAPVEAIANQQCNAKSRDGAAGFTYYCE